MNKLLVGLTGACAGAAIMYVADPREGARRRARLGRLVSHPGAIYVAATHGTVTLSGPIFQAELEQVLEGVTAVPGVIGLENRLEAHAEAGHVPGLEGPGPRTMPTVAAKWLRGTPTARVTATAAGLALLALAMPATRVRAAGGAAGVELLTWALGGARR